MPETLTVFKMIYLSLKCWLMFFTRKSKFLNCLCLKAERLLLSLYENMMSEFNSESLGPYCRSLHNVGVSYLWKLLHFECLIKRMCRQRVKKLKRRDLIEIHPQV